MTAFCTTPWGAFRGAPFLIEGIIMHLHVATAILTATVSIGPALGHEWPDGPNKSYLENLQRPDNHRHPHRDEKSRSCCGAADTVKTKFKVEPGDGPYPEDRWYAWLRGAWVRVPPDKIVPDYAPDGQPYLFVLADTIQCFVRPKGGL